MNSTGAKGVSGPAAARGLVLGLVNGALWSVGNGLTTGTLIYYLAQELGVRGLGLSVLIAAPSMAGLLRLATPAIVRRLGGVKPTSVAFFTASYALLAAGMPTAVVGLGVDRSVAFTLLTALVVVHQLLEYIASAALWSWFGGLVPPRIRGRYFARRQVWQLAALVPTLLAGGAFAYVWRQAHIDAASDARLWGYLLPTTVGAFVLLLSVVPLTAMPAVDVSLPRRQGAAAQPVGAFRDRPFRRLLAYRAWFSFFNGVTQAAQNVFVYRVLHVPALPMLGMQLGMRLGQIGLSPAIGRFSDRNGNRPVLVAAQWFVSTALLFYAVATPGLWWLTAGAWLLWIGYAGTNICLYNLMLKLAPDEDSAAHVSTFEALGGVAHGLSVIAGGWLLDRLTDAEFTLSAGPLTLDAFATLFVFGWLTRTAGVAWLVRIPEPGARSWRAILTHKEQASRGLSAAE